MHEYETGNALNDRVAVVAGASRGIGRAIAVGFAAQGATVIASARNSGDLDAAVEEMRHHGNGAAGVLADAADPEGAREPVRRALAEHGRVDVLVNAVGEAIGSRDPFDPTSGFEATLHVTLLSAWWATHEALPHMRERGYGRIVNIGSGATRSGIAGGVGYVAAKHGVAGMTKAVAVAAGPHGITVNCLSPGWTNTPRIDWDARARDAGVTVEEFKRGVEVQIAQQRVPEPTDLVAMAVLLGSEGGRAITGQVIHVDGGYRI